MVDREEWPHIEVKGKGGRGGIRREYQPSQEVMALIEAHLKGDIGKAEQQANGELEFDRAYAKLTPYARDALLNARLFQRSEFNASKLHALRALSSIPEGSALAKVVKKRINDLINCDSDKRVLSAWFFDDSYLARANDDAIENWLTTQCGPVEAIEVLFCILLFKVNPHWLLTGEGVKDYFRDPLSSEGIWDLCRAWPIHEIAYDSLEGDLDGLSAIPEVLAKCLTAARNVLGTDSDAEAQSDLGIKLHSALRRLYPYSAKLHEALTVDDLEHLGRFVLATHRLLPTRA